MNISFWSLCRRLVHRLRQGRPAARRRLLPQSLALVEELETRALLSSTPAMIADINPGPASSPSGWIATIGSTAYFAANDGVHGLELWKTDGTNGGTSLVVDLLPGSGSSSPENLTANVTSAGGTLFFTANDDVHGWELWKSDGTAAGTALVADINPGGGSAYLSQLTSLNGTLFFQASDGVHGRELWKSDGTAAGTVMVKDISPGYQGAYLSGLTKVNGTLYFGANDGTHGVELWKSDGTAAGTTLVKDLFPGGYSGSYGGYYPNGSNPGNLTDVNGTLFFTANSPTGYRALWKSDGTANGTVQVSSVVSYLGRLTNVNGTLFFAASSEVGTELWKSDGTAAGTTLVKDIDPRSITMYDYWGNPYLIVYSSNPDYLTNVNGTLFFTAVNSETGGELWKSDGTAAGTVLVKDINPGTAWPGARNLTNVNGTLYFSAMNSNGTELWKSDGTAAGTTMIADINPGSSSSYPSSLTNLNGTLLFTAHLPGYGRELWAVNTVATPGFDVTGFPSTTAAGIAGSFTVTARNADGSINTNFRGTIRFTSTDPQAALPSQYTFTAADNGTRTFSATLKTAGIHYITATDTASASNVGSTGSVQVKAAAASVMTVSGFPASTTAGAPGSITVTLKDSYGNIASGYTGTVRFSSSDANAALPAMYTFTAADAGIQTFSLTLKTAGLQSIAVVDTALASLGAAQNGVSVKAGAAKQFQIGAPTSIKAGVPFSLTLTVRDAYGNTVTDYTGTVRFTSTDRSALLPGNYTFTAADNGVHTFTGLVLRKKGNQKISIMDTQSSSLSATLTTKVSPLSSTKGSGQHEVIAWRKVLRSIDR